MYRAEPVIAWAAPVATETGSGLHLYGCTTAFGECNDESRSAGTRRVLRARPMASFTDWNSRVGTIGGVQAERVQRVAEVIGFEPMAGEAGFFADGARIERERIIGDMCRRESGSRWCRSPSGWPRRIAQHASRWQHLADLGHARLRLTRRAFLSRQVSQRQQAEYAGESYMGPPCSRLTHGCASYILMLTSMRHVELVFVKVSTRSDLHVPFTGEQHLATFMRNRSKVWLRIEAVLGRC